MENSQEYRGPGVEVKVDEKKLEEIKRECREFFCLKQEDQIPDPAVRFLFTRQEMDDAMGRETEDYLAACATPDGLYFIDQSVIEQITPHKKGYFWETYRHELNHWYYNHITGVRGNPRWLAEGLANQFAGMRTNLPEPTEESLAEKYFSYSEDEVFRWGNLMAYRVLVDYGNEKLAELLSKFEGEITKEKFDKIFEETFGISMAEFEQRVKAINDEKWKEVRQRQK